MTALHSYNDTMILFCMAIALDFIPVTACEIRHLNGHSTIGDGGCGQFAEARPFGGVVNVLIERQTIMKAIDEAVVHDEVHAAVASHFLGFFLDFDRDGVEVFLHDFVAHLGGNKSMWVKMLTFGEETGGQLVLQQRETFNRIFVGKAFGTRELIQTVVRSVSVNIMFDEESLAFLGLDHRGGHVTVGEVVHIHHFLGDLLAVIGRRAHRDQGLHAVATVNVEGLAERSEAVGGVDIARVVLVELEAPVFVILVPEWLEVVDVSALAVDEFAEHALLGHVESGQFEEVVTAVLEHHAVALGLFGNVDKLPTFFK